MRLVGLLLLLMLIMPWIAIAGDVAQSIDQAEAWYERLIGYLLRPGLGAAMVGAVMAFVVPQRVKMDFPLEWSDRVRRIRTRQVAFWAGVIPTLLLWPLGWPWKTVDALQAYGIWVGGVMTAIAIGAGAPWTYRVIMNQAYKRGFLDEERWSGETRAQLKRQDPSQDG